MDRGYIEEVLIALGIPSNAKGYKYIADAIEYIDEHPEGFQVMKGLYTSIANAHNDQVMKVERAIRHGLDTARGLHHNYETVNRYLGSEHMANADTLMILHKRIKDELEGKKIQLVSAINKDELREMIRGEICLALLESNINDIKNELNKKGV